MSVCIAGLCNRRRTIVCVTDQRVSFGNFSAEFATLKNQPLGIKYTALYAGNDVEHAEPILRIATQHSIKAKKRMTAVSPTEAAMILDEAYSEHLQAHIENKILRKHNFDGESFRKEGSRKCTPDIYAKVWEKIDRTTLSLVFLLCGFDAEGEGHIEVVTGDGAPVSHDPIGFWAIGTGAAAAMSSLSFHVSQRQFSVHLPVEPMVYLLLAAKFMAESASDVGPSTFITIMHSDGSPNEFISPQNINQLRLFWRQVGAPQLPKDAAKMIASALVIEQAGKLAKPPRLIKASKKG